MLTEIRRSDLVRTLVLSAFALALLSLLSYSYGWFATPYRTTIFEGLLALIVVGAIFDIYWLNAKRIRLRSTFEKPISHDETHQRDMLLARKLGRLVAGAVIMLLTIQFLVRLWFIFHG